MYVRHSNNQLGSGQSTGVPNSRVIRHFIRRMPIQLKHSSSSSVVSESRETRISATGLKYATPEKRNLILVYEIEMLSRSSPVKSVFSTFVLFK